MSTPRRSRVRVVSALVVAAGLLTAACTDDENPRVGESDRPTATTTDRPTGSDPGSTGTDVPSTGDGPAVEPTPDQDEIFGWEQFSQDENVEIGSIEVPIDYDDPSKGTFDLFVARHRATDPDKRIGTLLVNPGGPGVAGSDYGLYASQVYSDTLLEHFDILGWDPRGVGLSEPAIDCITDYDRYVAGIDITPDDEAERQRIVDLAREYADLCVAKNADILPYIGTNNSARDMDAIRAALGEDQISYFGWSYGSELGATWATLFPDTVRAAVLDGAVDPTAPALEQNLAQTKGFEATLSTFLAQCSADDDCAFHNDGDAEGAFDALLLDLDEDPIPSDPGRPDVDRGLAISATAQAMYAEFFWPELEQALADAQDGDGSGLLALHDAYYRRLPDGTWDNTLEAFQSISCMDDAERRSVEEEDALAPRFNEAAPRMAPGTTGSYFCTFFPESQDPRVDITGVGAGPILVVGTTGDAATPLESTEGMARALEEGVLLVIVADQHTGYGVNDCSYDVIDGYLVDLDVPEDGTRCD